MVSFRIYGMFCKDSRTKVGDYVRLAWAVIRENRTAESIHSAIRYLGSDHPIDRAIEEIRTTDCYYGWQSELRYVLRRYEEHLGQTTHRPLGVEAWEKIWAVSPSDSIEHIQPQSKADSERGKGGIYAHRIGNLTLLTPADNSRASNKEPSAKVDIYRASGLLITSDLAVAAQTWDLAAVEAREDRILAWMRLAWADPT